MSVLSSIQDLKSALADQNNEFVKTQCGLAFKYLEGVDSVSFPLARSEAYLGRGELEESLQDAQTAISLDKSDPKCNLALGQAHQALANRAFQDRKIKCVGNQHFSTHGRLNSSLSSNNTLRISLVKSFDPSFLPREVSEIIFQFVPPESKSLCLRVCKGWKAELEMVPMIWRRLQVTLSSQTEKKPEFSPIEHFDRNSGHALRFVSITFKEDLSDEQLNQCFARLEMSSKTLETVIPEAKFKI